MEYRIRDIRNNEEDKKELESERGFNDLLFAIVFTSMKFDKPGQFVNYYKKRHTVENLKSITTKNQRIK